MWAVSEKRARAVIRGLSRGQSECRLAVSRTVASLCRVISVMACQLMCFAQQNDKLAGQISSEKNDALSKEVSLSQRSLLSLPSEMREKTHEDDDLRVALGEVDGDGALDLEEREVR